MIRQAASPRRWIGLSIDAKPIPGAADLSGYLYTADDVTPGSTFFETDTLLTATWNGAAWVAGTPANDAVLQQLRVNGDELLRIRRVLETVNELNSDDLL
jgi:hypothetical protein